MSDSTADYVIATPALPGRKRAAIAVSAVLVVVAAATLPFADAPGPWIDAFLPAYGATLVAINLLTAYLLWGQFIVSGALAAALLGTTYLFCALLIAPHTLIFPGVLGEASVLGADDQASAWMWGAWNAGYPLLLCVYALIEWKWAPVVARRMVWPIIAALLLGVVAVVVGLVALFTLGHELLPRIVDDNGRVIPGNGAILAAVNAVALLLIVLLLRCRTMVQLWLAVAALASLLGVVVTLMSAQRYALGWYVARICSVFADGAVLAALLHEMTMLYARLVGMRDQLHRQATTDALSGLANRRQFDTAFQREWDRARREKLPMALLMIDIDHFKIYNDKLGHPEGDICIRSVARAIEAAIRRPGDIAARYGGEEFAIILPNTDHAGMLHIAERIREEIAGLALPHPIAEGRRVTVSIGAAGARPALDGDRKVLLKSADTALYRAKKTGRDRVAAADAPVPLAMLKSAV